MISVIVPAHDEAGRVSRCLRALIDDAAPDELEILVVANGCADGTPDEARAFGPPVRVLELDAASKVAALNAGDRVATSFPRFYVDADVEIPLRELREVAEVLRSGPALLAAPTRLWLTAGSPWIVRSYHRFLQHLPQVRDSLIGGGVLGVSELGRGRFDAFPEVIGDDLWLESRFAPHERCVVPNARSRVEMPHTLSGLLARRTRVALANRQARSRECASSSRWRNLLSTVRDRPVTVIDLPAFLGVTLVAELRAERRARRGADGWARDESTR
jgi:glycosyltransferase involved in cell wall biosynthesis